MKLERIINSLLETDLYKFSMGQAIYHQFSDYKTTWSFKCRNTDVHFTPEMVQENTGFEVDVSNAELMEGPDPEIIRLIREEIDPGQAFIKVPAA